MRREGVLVAALLVIAAAGCKGSSTTDDALLVVQECEDSVQANLTYDAHFTSGTAVKQDDGTWTASGSVVAQNGFGATSSHFWTCTVDANDVVTTSLR